MTGAGELLDGRVAIVTGAGHGLGAAHAQALAAHGAAVIVNDAGVGWSGAGSDVGLAEQTAAKIRDAGGTAVAHVGDCADWTAAEEMVSFAIETFGGLDILVLNAGIERSAPVWELAESDWDAVTRVHLKGHFAPARFTAQHWRAEALAGRPVYGRVITTSSITGLTDAHEFASIAYATAKAGITGFTMSLAGALADLGVTVNCIVPSARTKATVLDGLAASERLVADRVSPLVVYLASARAADVTGGVFRASGGVFYRFEAWQPVAPTFKDDVWEVDELADHFERVVGASRPRRLLELHGYEASYVDGL